MRNKDNFTFKDLFKRENIYSLVTTLVLLAFSFIVYHFANAYAVIYSARPTSTYVGDLILDNLPVINFNFIIVEVALISLFLAILFVILYRPRYIIVSFKTMALFNIIRALFTSLTHLNDYPGHAEITSGLFGSIYSFFNLNTGFFFSGHTGLPFLFALIFWKDPILRTFFLSLSVIFGISVLFAHVHYSIDVLAAPFMAYGIFMIAKYLFAHDYKQLG